ncbi:alpha/beta fold hydrolase [Streptomyces durmitorensis]|uniref:Alpha/beta fold hydrolase n=1 Tax=Streptomyces durmitorensis TaxID=319947 RepID=A0ABY4PRI6_9ACTN|nr:alpha/beta hydrolase [Streptomyces durmitorensis]UQT56447.1 alpha/beta fold hydrolase [Streptomyces durmitorensis]
MSRPPTFTPPPGVDAHRLRTARGDFAALDARPPAGQAKGTVLLLPGFTGSKEDFIALLKPIADAGYRAVSVDGRGQYETEGPAKDESPYIQAELAQDVLAQTEAVGGTPHLLGHSLGGLIARAATLSAPADTFASLTLMSSGPAAVSPSQQDRAKMLTDALAALSMADVWAAMQALDPPEDADLDGAALRTRWLRHSPAQLIATGKQLCAEPDRVAELDAVPLRKHVISGERDDTWPIAWLDDMADRLHAHRTVVTGAEHSPNTDRPTETAAALIAFWDQGTTTTGNNNNA